MRKILSFVILTIITITVKAQDIIQLKHTNYTSHFSKSKKYPVMVEWFETKALVGCPNPLLRRDNFKPDPQIPNETNIGNDYINSGYDRGHLMPAKSNQCQTQAIQDESFYYSNMAAQTHRLNAGDWKSLEVLTREIAVREDSVHIWAGNIGELKKIGTTTVPTKCWKVVYVVKSKEWMAFIFDNDLSNPDGINNNKVDVKDVEKLSGFKFK